MDMENAADALGGGSEEGAGEEGAQAPASNTFFLPKDFLGGKAFKAGDTISLTVVGTDADGDTEVSMGGGDESDWKTDLRKTMAADGQEVQPGNPNQ
jgi:hypothetical protein